MPKSYFCSLNIKMNKCNKINLKFSACSSSVHLDSTGSKVLTNTNLDRMIIKNQISQLGFKMNWKNITHRRDKL